MPAITFYKHEPIPMEMHKVKIVQQLQLLPTAQRLQKMQQAGFNTFQLHNGDIFLDMLTDSGVNAMSDLQQSAMLRADDAYAGSETFFRMRDKLEELFGMPFCLPRLREYPGHPLCKARQLRHYELSFHHRQGPYHPPGRPGGGAGACRGPGE